MAILNCIIGIIFVFLVAFLISNNKKKINWKTVIIGFLIQFIFAFAALKWSVGKYILSRISLGVQSVIDYAKEGISFIFGSLSKVLQISRRTKWINLRNTWLCYVYIIICFDFSYIC